MIWDEAIVIAERELRGMEGAAIPLRLAPPEFWQERSWCYVFPFNTAVSYEHNDPRSMIPTGPLIVPKDGTGPWVAPSAYPVERILDQYEREHGISG